MLCFGWTQNQIDAAKYKCEKGTYCIDVKKEVIEQCKSDGISNPTKQQKDTCLAKVKQIYQNKIDDIKALENYDCTTLGEWNALLCRYLKGRL